MNFLQTRLASRSESTSGFSLIEVAIALGIAAFCFVAVLGLLTVGLGVNGDSVQQTEVMNLVSLLESDLHSASQGGIAKSPTFQVTIPNHPTTGQSVVSPLFLNEDATIALTAADARYRVTLTFGEASGRSTTPVNILVTCPALLPPGNAPFRFETGTMLDRN